MPKHRIVKPDPKQAVKQVLRQDPVGEADVAKRIAEHDSLLRQLADAGPLHRAWATCYVEHRALSQLHSAGAEVDLGAVVHSLGRLLGLIGKGIDGEPQKLSRKQQRRLWVARAMLLKRDNPEWTDKQVASAVGVDPAQLTRCREYQALKNQERERGKAKLPRGRVTRDPDTGLRDVEAYGG